MERGENRALPEPGRALPCTRQGEKPPPGPGYWLRVVCRRESLETRLWRRGSFNLEAVVYVFFVVSAFYLFQDIIKFHGQVFKA
ncbi:MAG: hypothetical protein FD177_135 [Desulfovibrionaceae bacterium]|nr:MAG: hypothetical protein FD177_135 [Desulfovibrionaceae bacterium]